MYYTGVLPLSCVPSLPPTSLFLRQSLSKCPSESLTCNPPVSVLAEEGIESWALCVLGKHAITELHLQPFAAFFFLILEKATCGTYLPYSFWCPFFFLSMLGIETEGLLSSTVPAHWCCIGKFMWLDFPLMEKQNHLCSAKSELASL